MICWFERLPYAYESSVVLAACAKDDQPIPSGQVPRLHSELKSAPIFQSLIHSDPFDEQHEFGETSETLLARLSNNTRLLEERQGTSVVVYLTYRDLAPEAAEKGARVLAQVIASADLERESESGFAFRVVQPANPATGPIRPRKFMLTMLGLCGGLLLGLLFAGVGAAFK
jgi:uncharacterized protein involved in exopolysaccharide biosynthesis